MGGAVLVLGATGVGRRRAAVTVEEVARVLGELSRQVERVAREDQVGIQTVLLASGLAMILVAILGTAVTKNPAFAGLVVAGVSAIVLSKEVVNKIPGTFPAGPSIGPLIQAAPPADAPKGGAPLLPPRKSGVLGELTNIKCPIEFINVSVKQVPVPIGQLTSAAAACSHAAPAHWP